jgi:hypothetical protein
LAENLLIRCGLRRSSRHRNDAQQVNLQWGEERGREGAQGRGQEEDVCKVGVLGRGEVEETGGIRVRQGQGFEMLPGG